MIRKTNENIKTRMQKGKRLFWKKTKFMAMLLAAGLIITIAVGICGCGRKTAIIQVFQYERNEDGTVVISGLTDKGKSNAKLTVPATLDGGKVVAIEGEAFRNDSNLQEVVFEEGVESIAENTFLNCSNLEKITFPSTLKDIGTNAIKNTKWEQSGLENGNEIIINNILVEIREGLSDYRIPDGIKSIASGVFYANAGLNSVTIPAGMETIGTYAFSGCTGLTKVQLPDSVQTIGYSAFSGCSSADITIPSSVGAIGQDAFSGVKHITYHGSLSGSPWAALSVN
jgi:hypothetical protein